MHLYNTSDRQDADGRNGIPGKRVAVVTSRIIVTVGKLMATPQLGAEASRTQVSEPKALAKNRLRFARAVGAGGFLATAGIFGFACILGMS